jgi:hypothetical protein
VELQGRVSELRSKGFGLAVISYDPPEILAAFAKQRHITFPLLSDAGSATIKAYGILNTVAEAALGPDKDDPNLAREVQKYVTSSRPTPAMVGMAFPGTFMIDRQGRVTARSFEDAYNERNTVSSVMMRLGAGARVTGSRISTTHLDLTTYASDASIAPGNRFTLAFDVVPRRGMHVYAPGASGYRVIAFTAESQPFVRFLPINYPTSEIYFFKPLNERVPVFRKPFALQQEVVVEASPQAQAAFRELDTLTLKGSLEYQACDDKICYNPESIPLSWTLTLSPLVRERPVSQP